jgi:nitrile hydratase
MDGIHDMGGMDGFGKVEPEPNEPVFHAAWEGRVLAMQRAMGYAGAWHIDMSRFAQERLPPQVYLGASYYQRWALAMECNVVERGYAGADELAAGHALHPAKPLARKLTPDVIKQGLTRGSFFRQSVAPARFKPGDRVRTKNIHPATHTRLPRLSGRGGDRPGRQSAMALHGGVRRRRAVGPRRRPDAEGLDRCVRALSRSGVNTWWSFRPSEASAGIHNHRILDGSPILRVHLGEPKARHPLHRCHQ